MERTEPPPGVVCDAGPLIHLDELDSLDLLCDFSSVLVPRSVWGEVMRHRPRALETGVVGLTQVLIEGGEPALVTALARSLVLGSGRRKRMTRRFRRITAGLTATASRGRTPCVDLRPESSDPRRAGRPKGATSESAPGHSDLRASDACQRLDASWVRRYPRTSAVRIHNRCAKGLRPVGFDSVILVADGSQLPGRRRAAAHSDRGLTSDLARLDAHSPSASCGPRGYWSRRAVWRAAGRALAIVTCSRGGRGRGPA